VVVVVDVAALVAPRGRCILRFAPSVASPQKFPSSLVGTGQFIAASATPPQILQEGGKPALIAR
jgi:hypothetical protein